MHLENLLSYLPGIGKKTEKNLRDHGINTWNDILSLPSTPYLNQKRLDSLKEVIRDYKKQLSKDPVNFIEKTFKQKDKFVLFDDFKDSVAYFDIETTGLSPFSSYTTTVAVWDGSKIKTFVRDENLDEFQGYIDQYKLLVSFYGSCFDAPFLTQEQQIDFSKHLHIDLCFVLRSLGYSGGLKNIEIKFGINRGELAGFDGAMAVQLWHKYKSTNDRDYLETLLAYNVEDVINLEYLMHQAWNIGREQYQLNLPKIELKQRNFENPYKVKKKIMSNFY